MNETINTEEAKRHLRLLLRRAGDLSGFIELRVFHDANKAIKGKQYWLPIDAGDVEIHEAVKWAWDRSEEGFGVFVGQNVRSEMLGTKEGIKALTAAYVDLDFYKVDRTLEEVEAAIAGLPEQPDLFISSGSGAQAIWFMAPTTDYGQWVAIQRGLYNRLKEFGADRVVIGDQARVLRLAGFPNQKKGESKATRIISMLENGGDGVRYAGDLSAVIGDSNDTSVKASGELIAKSGGLPDEIHEGGSVAIEGRNQFLFGEACFLRDRGYSISEIGEAIRRMNELRCKPPLEAAEVNTIISQAAKYAPTHTLTPPKDEEVQDLVVSFGKFKRTAFAPLVPVLTGLHQGEVGMFQAVHNVGKTTLAYNLSLCAAVGRPFPPFVTEEEAKPRRVMYFDAENRASFVQRDLDVMAMALTEAEQKLLEENLFVSVDREICGMPLKMSEPAHFELVKAHAKAHKPDLIFIDTAAAMFSLKSENDNSEVNRVVMSPLNDLARTSGAAVILIHHKSGKNQQSGDRSSHGRGASSFGDAPRLVVDIDPVRDATGRKIDDHIIVNCGKLKGRPFDDVVLKLDFDTRWFTRTDFEAPTEEVMFDKVVELVTGMMSKEQVTQVALERGMPVDEKLVDRILKRAKGLDLLSYSYTKYAPTARLVSRMSFAENPGTQGEEEADPFADMRPNPKPILSLVEASSVAMLDFDEGGVEI